MDCKREPIRRSWTRPKGAIARWTGRLLLVGSFSVGLLVVVWALAVVADSLQSRANRSLTPQWDESRDPPLGLNIAGAMGPFDSFVPHAGAEKAILVAYLGGCGGCSLQHPTIDSDRLTRFLGVVCIVQYEGQQLPRAIATTQREVRVVLDKDGTIGRLLNSENFTRLFAINATWQIIEKQRASEAGYEFIRRITQ